MAKTKLFKTMKKHGKKVMAASLVAALTLANCSYSAWALDETDTSNTKTYTLEERLDLAEELGILSYLDSDGYLTDSYYEGKSHADLNGEISYLVKSVTQEEIDI